MERRLNGPRTRSGRHEEETGDVPLPEHGLSRHLSDQVEPDSFLTKLSTEIALPLLHDVVGLEPWILLAELLDLEGK
jgi:hypothetical protein